MSFKIKLDPNRKARIAGFFGKLAVACVGLGAASYLFIAPEKIDHTRAISVIVLGIVFAITSYIMTDKVSESN